MKKLLSLFVVAIFIACKSQPQVHKHNKIDDLNSAGEVNEFIHSLLGNYFKNHVVIDTLAFKDNDFKKLAAAIKPKPWEKADFENNGFTDLLIIAKDTNESFTDDHYDIECIMDSGENRFFVKSLTAFFLNNSIATVRMVDSLPSIIYYDLDNPNTYYIDYKGDTLPRPFKKDTLIFKFGGFIEYNKKSDIYDIQNIKFETSGCFGSCPIFKLDIDKNKNGSYTATRHNKSDKGEKIEGTFKTRINLDDYKAVEELLSYINFPKLKDRYTVNWTDDQTATLTITYNNGKTKTISDYGQQGSFGLRQLYELLYALRLNQNWH